MENTTVQLTAQEVQAILSTLGQLPTQYGAGLYSFFLKKAEVFAFKKEQSGVESSNG